ncbi:GL26501 [Drosophila persimilis]|uniref:GL26501 n=1 Tax=Drosophila persimilis TaxID=7234 RepID=B4GSE8_DROPE|nr:GL26501 [Drosophila persimilis]
MGRYIVDAATQQSVPLTSREDEELRWNHPRRRYRRRADWSVGPQFIATGYMSRGSHFIVDPCAGAGREFAMSAGNFLLGSSSGYLLTAVYYGWENVDD